MNYIGIFILADLLKSWSTFVMTGNWPRPTERATTEKGS